MERDEGLKFMYQLLTMMMQKKGSDLFITAGFPPAMKIDGKMTPATTQPLSPQHTQELARAIMNDKQAAEFEATKECNFAISPASIGRFRVNAFVQQGRVGIIMRTINVQIPEFEDLKLPPVLKDVSMTKRGLVLFVGGTGSGKSTSLAAMIGYRNQNSYGHIITIEDPVEYVHDHRNCVITQREVGVDTDSWEIALKNTLRQAPDVILIGEIRDREVMEHAIAFAETGHLAMGTLHANNANQAIDRIINFFPEERRPQLLMDLSLNLKAIVSQRLIPVKEGKGRAAAVEVLLNSPLIADLIFKGEIHGIKEIMKKSKELGMKTFDMALFDLFEEGRISYDDALRFADSMNEVRLMIKLHSKESQDMDRNAGIQRLAIVQTPPRRPDLLRLAKDGSRHFLGKPRGIAQREVPGIVGRQFRFCRVDPYPAFALLDAHDVERRNEFAAGASRCQLHLAIDDECHLVEAGAGGVGNAAQPVLLHVCRQGPCQRGLPHGDRADDDHARDSGGLEVAYRGADHVERGGMPVEGPSAGKDHDFRLDGADGFQRAPAHDVALVVAFADAAYQRRTLAYRQLRQAPALQVRLLLEPGPEVGRMRVAPQHDARPARRAPHAFGAELDVHVQVHEAVAALAPQVVGGSRVVLHPDQGRCRTALRNLGDGNGDRADQHQGSP